MASPAKLAHVVLRAADVAPMIDWYQTVLEARVTFANEMLGFLAYDEEHHRVAFIKTGASERPGSQHTGLEHMAFTYATLGDLLDTYTRLAALDIRPFWTINHGATTSMYYHDPEGNSVELQIDNFESLAALQEWFDSGAFDKNPIGVEFDPDELVSRFQAGEPVEALIKP